METDERTVQSERLIIGSLFLQNKGIEVVIRHIRDEMYFTNPMLRQIYKIILARYEEGEPVDIFYVEAELEKHGRHIKNIHQYLTEMITDATGVSSLSFHCENLANSFARRAVKEWFEKNVADDKNDIPVESLRERIEGLLASISYRKVERDVVTAKTATETFLAALKAPEGRGVKTNIEPLDNHLGGLKKGDLIIIAARPSVGKTALSLDIACRMSKHIPALFFSLEMEHSQLIQRAIMAESGLSDIQLRNNEYQESLEKGIKNLEECQLFIDDTSNQSIWNIRSVARRMKREKDIQAMFVDYIQIISPPGHLRRESTLRQITEISKELKNIARELEIPVVAMSQLNRDVEKREGGLPKLSDLRDSGSIEQDGDVILLLSKKEVKENKEDYLPIDVLHVNVAKYRNGSTGTVLLDYNKSNQQFSPYVPPEKGRFFT